MPLFPTEDPAAPYGDLGNFRAWVQKNVKYPAEAFEKGIGGRVVLSFVVEKDGSVSSIEKLQSPGRVALGGGSPRHRLFAQVETRRTARTDRAREIYAPRGLPSYESVRYAGPGIRKVVFQPAPTKQTARRHNPDSPNRSARIPRINRLHESAARPAFPKPRSRGPASDPDFQAPAGSPQRLPRLSQATEPTISGKRASTLSSVDAVFIGLPDRRIAIPARPPRPLRTFQPYLRTALRLRRSGLLPATANVIAVCRIGFRRRLRLEQFARTELFRNIETRDRVSRTIVGPVMPPYGS